MDKPLSVLITGDFCPLHRIEPLLKEKNYPTSILSEVIEDVRKSDLAITNLECPIGIDFKGQIKKTGPNLNGHPSAINFLKKSHFDLVTLANNHIMDYGEDGLNKTLTHLEKENLDWIGVGEDIKSASTTKYIDIKNKTLAIVNIAENEWSSATKTKAGAHGLNPIKNFYSIQEAKSKANYVLVITHGGHEMYHLPSPRMKQLFRFFVDAGADAIVNHHTHCISGFEVYKDRPIYYSTGNFLFDSFTHRNSIWNEGLMVKIIFSEQKVEHSRIFFTQCNETPSLCQNTKTTKKLDAKITKFNKVIQDDKLLEDAFDQYCKDSKHLYENYIQPYKNRYLHFLRKKGIIPNAFNESKRRLLLNLIRCEAHKDVLQKILND